MFEEHIATDQIVVKTNKVNHKWDLGFEMQIEKRKWTYDPTLLATSKKLNDVVLSIRDLRDHDNFFKGGGTHEPLRCKFKCGRCGWKGHVHQYCTLEVELCHSCIILVTLGKIAHVWRSGQLKPHHLWFFRK